MSKIPHTNNKLAPQAKRLIASVALGMAGIVTLAFAMDCVYQHFLRA